MMEEVDFICSAKDCDPKSFSDEKQIISHKQKHGMVLSLTKPGHFPSDETPTPTRFIRNCEAIGLFQDLQNVNPFDETFKKAAEAVKRGEFIRSLNISTLGKAAGEDLHTPHIDLTSEALSPSDGIEDDVPTVVRTEADTSLKSTNTVVTPKTSLPKNDELNKEKFRPSNPDLRLFVRMPDGSLVQIPTIGDHLGVGPSQMVDNGAPRTIIISTQNTQSEMIAAPKPQVAPKPVAVPKPQSPSNMASAAVRQKLKATLLKTSKPSTGVAQFVSTQSSPSKNNSDTIIADARKEKRVTSTTSEEDHERKLKTLERNRIAAMKCREKRKKWVNDLRNKYENMCKTNELLVKEITFLRNEVTRLKSALLIACNQPHPVQDITATSVQIVTSDKSLERTSGGPMGTSVEPSVVGSVGRAGRGGLRLQIEGTPKVSVMDLDSPLVKSDEILSSAAPPTTPNEKLISFPELDRIDADPSEEKILSVIQINPNALSKVSSAFS